MIALIIGGTGTLGKEVLPRILQNPQISRVRILSRGEHTQMQMQEGLPEEIAKRVDFFVGDVRDRDRVMKASEDCDLVLHFAAMKSVDKAEYDPREAIKTNIEGTLHVIDACIENGVSKAIFTSTDKAVAPLNIYGASKLAAEKLFIAGNIGKHRTHFAVCRYGNVLGSQGSVLTKWKEKIEKGEKISITDENMTRFFILPSRAAEFVLECLYQMKGSEIFIPKMRSTTMINLARALHELLGKSFDLANMKWSGIRPGEKIHEVLISQDEVQLTTDIGQAYIRWPSHALFPVLKHGVNVEKGFTSYDAVRFTQSELREMVECQLGLSPKSAAVTWDDSSIAKRLWTSAPTSELTL